ncbi:hypothetical protein QE152_g2058 [Popillia japonica]|uniref:Uncharacterized protein n=1 Tax=Popillia japonica TaxID=7064 RepID=A0AAW1N4G7_POPJA
MNGSVECIIDANYYNSIPPDPLHLPYMILPSDSDIHYHQHYHHYPSTTNTIADTEAIAKYCSSIQVKNRNGNDVEDMKPYIFDNNNDYYKSRVKSLNRVHLTSSITFVRR